MESAQSSGQEEIVSWALKEWSSICAALAAGRQSITLRKGGIEEESGEFRAEHDKFLLFPTTEHEKSETLLPEGRAFIQNSGKQAEKSGEIAFTLYAECVRAKPIASKGLAQSLAELTLWTPDYIGERFDLYPQKPLLLLILRVYRLSRPLIHPRDASYAGCRSWVPLVQAPSLPPDLNPVLSDAPFKKLLSSIDERLRRTF